MQASTKKSKRLVKPCCAEGDCEGEGGPFQSDEQGVVWTRCAKLLSSHCRCKTAASYFEGGVVPVDLRRLRQGAGPGAQQPAVHSLPHKSHLESVLLHKAATHPVVKSLLHGLNEVSDRVVQGAFLSKPHCKKLRARGICRKRGRPPLLPVERLSSALPRCLQGVLGCRQLLLCLLHLCLLLREHRALPACDSFKSLLLLSI
mmetsp:Transcript_15840/g.37351  ORF Transcript_15840/g.37351 Transcript_15840/m.37351 type:complete len:202 (-) Transcript_15840:864-1469(-)